MYLKNILIFSIVVSSRLNAEMFFTPAMINSHIKDYTTDEIELLNKDMEVVRSVCFNKVTSNGARIYLATAGAPGARKTTILEKFLAAHSEYQNSVYLDFDPRTLRFMVHTYYAQSLSPFVIAASKSYDEVIQNAYKKWRGGSNFIALSLLEEAFANGLNITFGTTSTGAHIPEFFVRLKENDYKIILLLCSCEDDLRYEAINYRNQVIRFYQSSPEDAIAKGLAFPQKMETYFKYADRLYFYWSDSLFNQERLAGIWEKGMLTILDEEAMQRFINKHEQDRNALEETDIKIEPFYNFVENNGIVINRT